MALKDEIDNLITRVKDPARAINTTIQDQVILYANGLKGKLSQLNYALANIRQLSTQDPKNTAGPFSNYERIHFYSDSFWALQRALLDILAQLINQVLSRGIDERSCDFAAILKDMGRNLAGSPITPLLQAIQTDPQYTSLNDYRNCSIHRRQVYLHCNQSSVSTAYSTAGYQASSISASVPISTFVWLICDNPLDLTPSIALNRHLFDYSEGVNINIIQRIENIVSILLI